MPPASLVDVSRTFTSIAISFSSPSETVAPINCSTMADAVAKILDLQAEINRDIDDLVDLKRDIVTLLKRVDNTEYQTILEKRYLCFMTWEQIAVDLNYSIHHLYKLHYAALDICDRLMERDT